MTNDKKTSVHEFDAVLKIGDGPELPIKAIFEGPFVLYQIHGRVDVDFDVLRQSGELDESEMQTIEFGYPEAPILFMGVLPHGGFGGRNICIGIRTGEHVYPKNKFFISTSTAIDSCKPTGEPPLVVKPYD